MLNFRKLKQDFSSSILKEGKELNDKDKVISAKILKLDQDIIRFSAKISGNYENTYESEIEIDRFESQTIHSNCDCSYRYDCQHLAALIYYLENNIDSIIIKYSKEAEIDKDETIEEEHKKELLETIKEAKTKEDAKKDANYQKQVLNEYANSAKILSYSPFFLPKEDCELTKAEFALIFNPASFSACKKKKKIEFQISLRLPYRSKPLNISNIKKFLEAIRYDEPINVAGKKYYFSLASFDLIGSSIAKFVMNHARFVDKDKNDRMQRIAHLDVEAFGMLLSQVYDLAKNNMSNRTFSERLESLPIMPSMFYGSLETPLQCSFSNSHLVFDLEYIEPPSNKLLLNPQIMIDKNKVGLNDIVLFECAKPGMIYEEVYYKFLPHIKRIHLRNLQRIREMTIPEALFGTFVENALPEMKRFAEIGNENVIESFVTMPFVGEIKARCSLAYLDGELDASLYFSYDGNEIRSTFENVEFTSVESFVKEEGILSRNLYEERKVIEDLFQDFMYNPLNGTFVTKSEKKIVEFMTEIIPRFQDRVTFECPQNLLDQFIYDQTTYVLKLNTSDNVGQYSVDLKVEGELKGTNLDLLWECIASKRSFIELSSKKERKGKSRFSKILVLDLEKISKIVSIFDELGIQKLDSHSEERPLWSLVNIDSTLFENLPIKFSMSQKLQDIRAQMMGAKEVKPSEIPKEIKGSLRPYQVEGVYWLEKLRMMYLNGILADDMGLGKTYQAIVTLTQDLKQNKQSKSIVICPTSLIYNWQEEVAKFSPNIKTLIVDGIPQQRKKLIADIDKYNLIITSYTLMQKDVELYQETVFSYIILDEAQHIKNRGTRNAKSVKMLKANHKLILTGTPIENSLDELWSLFDFLMPGLLSSYDRFIEKYVRSSANHSENMEYLKKKVSPFILRRMKEDVLKDLPPVDEINYHTQLGEMQMQLYKSYAQSAKDELTKLVQRDGFDKVRIHVLATLTRLKQICCHPAIFAKEKPEVGDSAKYEMLLELLQGLVESNHKTVIFSQYTRMLKIMRDDFESRGINFSYLDGASKNRLQIVKEFNENKDIPVFLVSLKAGGTGLNITGADTVIHYDMWWNPAVENQATDRVHRIGQTKSVSSYKLITKGTIEEKIVEMQERKKGLVKKVVSCDDEAISKLTWEDVLELLQT